MCNSKPGPFTLTGRRENEPKRRISQANMHREISSSHGGLYDDGSPLDCCAM